MQRREFLAASAAAATGLLVSGHSAPGAEPAMSRPFFELRRYHFASAAKQQAYEHFLADAAVPAFNRAGVEPVGVFKLLAKDNPTSTPVVKGIVFINGHQVPPANTDQWQDNRIDFILADEMELKKEDKVKIIIK